MDRFVRGQDCSAPRCGRGIGAAAEFFPVIYAGFDSCDAFVVQRSRFPAAGTIVGTGADFVGAQTLQVVALAVENSHVRAEKFVSRAGQKIAVEGAHVNRSMGSVVDGIDITQSSRLPRQTHHFGDVVYCAHRIRCVADRDQPGPAPDLRSQVAHVESAIFFVEVRRADGHTLFFQRFPGREIGVVVEQGEDDLVAGAEFASKGAAQGESQRRHVGAKHDFVRIAIEKIRHRRTRFVDDSVGVAAGLVGAVGVGVVARQVIRDGVDYTLRHLRASWAVQKNCGAFIGMLADGLRERRELGADPG